MKNLLVIVFAISAAIHLQGQNYSLGAYSMSIKGSSNLHAWESFVKEVRASAQMTADANGLKEISSFYVEIPVKSIKSTKGSIMDGKTYDALKADKFANISFKLSSATINRSGNSYDINAKGDLSIAGTTRRTDIYVKGTAEGDNITFKGSKWLKMTDFGVNPPTALMGTLTTGNDVEIVFQITMKKS